MMLRGRISSEVKWYNLHWYRWIKIFPTPRHEINLCELHDFNFPSFMILISGMHPQIDGIRLAGDGNNPHVLASTARLQQY